LIVIGHGAGGRLTHELVERHFLKPLQNPALSAMLDSGCVGDLAMTTDAFVVTPRFFPGGDLGRLAVAGTVNDLVAVGAIPIGLCAAFILEEGLALEELDRLVASMAATAREAGVEVVAGDTKVVPRGACDGAFITTSGVGRLDPGFRPEPARIQTGDAVLVTGTLADHGVAVMACREGLRLGGELRSDVAPLRVLVDALRDADLEVHAMRDPTRGGAAQCLFELAQGAQRRVVLREQAIPVAAPVRAACELLGLDPLYVANEGKLMVVLPEAQAEQAVALLRAQPLGAHAAIIGQVEDGTPGCELITALGGRRSLRMASGELLPRIC